MSDERVVTVYGPNPTRPLSEFDRNIAGTEFYVGPNATGAGDDGRAGRSKESSLATLAKALTLATASKNDIIYLLPGHAETLSTAAAIAISKIGVRIVGLGTGALRPTFTFSAVDATITMTAASCSIENVIIKPSIDAVVSPIVVSAADCKVNVEIQDESATVECECGILTTAGADRLDVNLRYRGFIAGDACVNAIRLVGVDTAKINVDFYGVASTSIVEFHTTACHDIDITGEFYNDGTSLTKNVVDTVTGSTWSVQGWDGNSNANFTGGDNAAIASDDVSSVTAAVATAQADLDILTGATGANLLTATQTSIDAIEADTDLCEKVVKKDAATMVNAQTLFTVAGGPIEIVGLVSICETLNDNTASTLQYNATPTTGSATTISNASASLADAAPGASVTLAGTALATAALLSAGGPNLIANPGTIMIPIGAIDIVVGVGSTTGTWAHYLRYKPLAAGVTVT